MLIFKKRVSRKYDFVHALGCLILMMFVLAIAYTVICSVYVVYIRVFSDETQQLASPNLKEDDLIGVWRIEDLGGWNGDKKGWQESRLVLYEDFSFEIFALTPHLKKDFFMRT